jgi:DNA topoisomerase-2
MHLFNAQGQIVKYDTPEQIMREFYDLRLEHYEKRKNYMVGDLERQLSVLDNKCRFIKEVIAGSELCAYVLSFFALLCLLT